MSREEQKPTGSADSKPQASTRPPAKPRGGGAIVISSIGLLVLIAVFLFALRPPQHGASMQDILGEGVSLQALPFGFTTITTQRLSNGRRVALFGNPNDLPATDELGPEQKSEHGWEGMGMGMGKTRKFNPDSSWLKVPVGEPGKEPWQATLVRYPSGPAEKVLGKEFGRLKFQDLSQISEKGGSTPMDTGYVQWNGYRSPFVIERHFRKEEGEPVAHDTLRVNLTRGQHALVLYARWRPGQLASIEALVPLLEAITID